ncbi:hypothetical protein D3C80_895220 [compost metagenome]
MFSYETEQVLTITGLAEHLPSFKQVRLINPALLVCDFFKASDFQALTVLDGLHVLRGFQEAVVGAALAILTTSLS